MGSLFSSPKKAPVFVPSPIPTPVDHGDDPMDPTAMAAARKRADAARRRKGRKNLRIPLDVPAGGLQVS